MRAKDTLRNLAGSGFDPAAHWQRVLRTFGLPQISYDYAKEALKKLGHEPERQPGEDKEEDEIS